MSVGLLLITHSRIGSALLDCVEQMLDGLPLPAKVLEVELDADTEDLLSEAQQLCAELDQGQGVLLLTDLYGSTPANLANKLMAQAGSGARLASVSGLNLPMLVRVCNYPAMPLADLAEKARYGGQRGIQ